MEGGHDPDNRRCMPWDDSQWDKDLRTFHQQVIAIRKNSHALQNGGFQILLAEGDLIAFQRESLQEKMIVIAYRGDDDMPAITLDMVKANIADGTTLTDLLTNAEYTVLNGKLTLAGLSHGQSLFLKA